MTVKTNPGCALSARCGSVAHVQVTGATRVNSNKSETKSRRWLAAGNVLRRRSPRLYSEFLATIEHTVAALPSDSTNAPETSDTDFPA